MGTLVINEKTCLNCGDPTSHGCGCRSHRGQQSHDDADTFDFPTRNADAWADKPKDVGQEERLTLNGPHGEEMLDLPVMNWKREEDTPATNEATSRDVELLDLPRMRW